MVTPKQLTAAALILAIAIAALGVAVYSIYLSPAVSYPGQAQPVVLLQLDFPSRGVLSALNVKPGDMVRQGEALATQDSALLAARLDSSKADLTRTQAALQQLASTPLPQQVALAQADVNQADARLTDAQQALNDTVTLQNLLTQLAQQSAASAQAAVTADQASYALICAAPVQQATVDCQSLARTLVHDQQFAQQQTTQIQAAEAQAQSQEDQARSEIDTAQQAITVAQAQYDVTSATATAAEVAQAQADVARAQAQVEVDQLTLQQATLTAPAAGLVLATGAYVGDLVGDIGSRQYAGPSAQAQTAPGFSLFPAPPTQINQGSLGTYRPVVSLAAAGGWEVTAQIPEDSINGVRLGERGAVTFSALPGVSVGGRVATTEELPVVVSNAIYYDVEVILDRVPAGLLPGMTASVSLPRS